MYRRKYRTNPRVFFRKCNSINKSFKPPVTIMKDEIGNLLINETSIASRFREYFNSFLNVTKERCNAVAVEY